LVLFKKNVIYSLEITNIFFETPVGIAYFLKIVTSGSQPRIIHLRYYCSRAALYNNGKNVS